MSKIILIFLIFHWRIQKCEINFYDWHILLILIFDVFSKTAPKFLRSRQNPTKTLEHIYGCFQRPLILIVYSPLTSAMLSCLNEVTLVQEFVCDCLQKFIYSEKATKFCEIFTLLLSYVVPWGVTEKVSAVGFCLCSGLFGSCNSD